MDWAGGHVQIQTQHMTSKVSQLKEIMQSYAGMLNAVAPNVAKDIPFMKGGVQQPPGDIGLQTMLQAVAGSLVGKSGGQPVLDPLVSASDFSRMAMGLITQIASKYQKTLDKLPSSGGINFFQQFMTQMKIATGSSFKEFGSDYNALLSRISAVSSLGKQGIQGLKGMQGVDQLVEQIQALSSVPDLGTHVSGLDQLTTLLQNVKNLGTSSQVAPLLAQVNTLVTALQGVTGFNGVAGFLSGFQGLQSVQSFLGGLKGFGSIGGFGDLQGVIGSFTGAIGGFGLSGSGFPMSNSFSPESSSVLSTMSTNDTALDGWKETVGTDANGSCSSNGKGGYT